MDLRLNDEQEAVRDTFARLFEAESTPARVRAVETTGLDRALWDRLVDLDAPMLAVPEAAGGGGGTLLDLAVVVQEQGRHLATLPLLEAAVVARLLARVSGGLDGWREPRALAVRPATESIATLVPAGAIAQSVVALCRDELLLLTDPSVRIASVPRTLAACPVADWRVDPDPPGTREVLARGSAACELWEQAVDEWKVLTAVLLVGAGRGALDLAVRYTTERHQFGVPIGSFQTVAHRLADAAVALEGAGLLADDAAWRMDSEHHAELLSAMALAYASVAAQSAVKESLHFFGGYGFMLEYDIQLYFRRIKAWSLLGGDPERAFEHIGRALVPTRDTTG